MLNIYKYIFLDIKLFLNKWKTKQNEENHLNNNGLNYTILLGKKLEQIFFKRGFVNINEIDEELSKIENKNDYSKRNVMNIGFQLDPDYTLKAMMTTASILDSQKQNILIRLHYAVVLNFTVLDMLKIYSLRYKIRKNAEFNFYNASRVEKDLSGLNVKGPGAVAKLLLPQLLPDNVKKLLVFDTGDLLVLKDLTEQYNWDMKENLYVGVPGAKIGKKSLITNQTYKSYINIGSFLINVTKVKSENMYDKFVKYKNYYHSHIGDQDLLNDISIGKVGMYNMKFGKYSPLLDDNTTYFPSSFNLNKNIAKYFPNNIIEYLKSGYTSPVIHQWNGKWSKGSGLTLYRRLAQYYIRYAGIWEETCKKFPGYCIK